MKKAYKFNKKLSTAFTLLLAATAILGPTSAYADEAVTIPAPLVQYSFENELKSTGSQDTKAGAVDILSRYDESSIVDLPDTSVTYSEGKKGQAAYLNGSTGLNLNITMDSESYTFSYWIKPEAITTFTPSLIITRTTFSADEFINVTLSTGWLSPVVWTHITNPYDVRYETGIMGGIQANQWAHITFVVDESLVIDDEHVGVTLYINGFNVASGFAPREICTETSKYWFGINIWDDMYIGYVDEFKCFNTTLNDAQVKQLYLDDGGDPNASNPAENQGGFDDWFGQGDGNNWGDDGNNDWNDNWNDNNNNDDDFDDGNNPLANDRGNATILDDDYNSNDYLQFYVEPPTEPETLTANEVNPFALEKGKAVNIFYCSAAILFTIVVVIFLTIYKKSKQHY